MFGWNIEMAEEGMTVPYPPLFDNIRSNGGFVDARGRPDLVAGIPECMRSLAMRDLLVLLAQPRSQIFSVGCDVGNKFVTDDGPEYHTAGGYVQVMSKSYARQSPDEYVRFGEDVASMLEAKGSDHEWRLNLVLTPVQFNLDKFNSMTGSLWVWFHAFGGTETEALAEREAYILCLSQCLLDEDNLACFE